MQGIGVVLAVAAIWFMYCGTHGLNPITLFQAIVKEPDNAGTVIEDAIAEAEATKYVWPATISGDVNPPSGDTGGVAGIVSNPWSGFTVTAPFGKSGHVGVIGSAHVHNGIDYAMPVGTKLPAVIAGTAVRGFGVLSGNTMTVNGTGIYKGWTTIYMHCSRIVKTGPVRAGEIVAESGGQRGAEGSGDSTGPHLHFEVHRNGSVVNPSEFWQWANANKTNVVAPTKSPSKTGPLL